MTTTRKAYPGFWQAVLLCFAFVILQTCLIIPFAILDAVFKLHLVTHPAVLGVVNLVACALVLVMAWLIGRPAVSEVCPLRRVAPLALVGVIVASGGAIILLSEMDNLVRVVLPPPQRIVRLLADLSFSSQHVWASVFLLVIVAPVTEELMFRGLILRAFLRRFSVVGAALLSAMLFGAVHLNPWQFVSAAGLGMLFAWWYTRTQSLIPSLLGHALANATVVGHQSLPFKVRGFNAGEPFGGSGHQPFWFDALGVALLLAGLWLFRRATPAASVSVEPRAEPPVAPGPAAPPPVPPGNAASSPPGG